MNRKNLSKFSLLSFGVIISFLCISGMLATKAYADLPTFDSEMGMYISLAENPFQVDEEKSKATQEDETLEITSGITYSDNFKGNVSYTWHYKLDGADTWVDIDCTTEELNFDTSSLTPGNYIFQIVAKDDLGNSCTQDFKITVSGDTTPSKGKTDKNGTVTLNDNKQDPTKPAGGDNVGDTTVKITDKDGNPIENAEVEIDDEGKIHVILPDGTEKTDIIIKVTDADNNPIKDKPVKVNNSDGTLRADDKTNEEGILEANYSKNSDTDNSSSDEQTSNTNKTSGDTNKDEGKGSLATTGDQMKDILMAVAVIDLFAIAFLGLILLKKRRNNE